MTDAQRRDYYFTKLRDSGDIMSGAEYAATARAWHIFSLKAKYENGQRVVPPVDFKEIERIHKEWERYDLDRARRYWEDRDMAGRYKVVPNDPKGPMLKFKHGSTLTMRSSGDKD